MLSRFISESFVNLEELLVVAVARHWRDLDVGVGQPRVEIVTNGPRDLIISIHLTHTLVSQQVLDNKAKSDDGYLWFGCAAKERKLKFAVDEYTFRVRHGESAPTHHLIRVIGVMR